MVRLLFYVALAWLFFSVASCSKTPVYWRPIPSQGSLGDIPKSSETMSAALDSYYGNWAGTMHLNGGEDMTRMDCSAFVQLAYTELFNISLPRTTRAQVRHGTRIGRGEVVPADLVFFKTGLFSRHVGIYRGDGTFMHVSTKRGLTLSSLEHGYWSDHFWQARRIIQQ